MDLNGVRRQALHPFTDLPVPPSFRRITREEGVVLVIHPMPMAQIAEPLGDGPGDVEAAVAAARDVLREHGKTVLIWWLTPEHAHLGPALEELGLAHEDTPGFEKIENAMILLQPPTGARSEGVAVETVETFEQFAAGNRLQAEVFGFTPAMLEQSERELPDRYAEYCLPGNPARSFNAIVDGRVVGAAAAFVGHAGVNLFGGAVAEDARGRGVYRALLQARWELAVASGTPALTMQAGVMSKPIAERVGFELVEQARLYVDEL